MVHSSSILYSLSAFILLILPSLSIASESKTIGSTKAIFRSVSGNLNSALAPALNFKAKSIEAGIDFTCGISVADRVFCWGANTGGQMGRGTVSLKESAQLVPGLSTISQLTVGHQTACVLQQGKIWCWGDGISTPKRLNPGITGDTQLDESVVYKKIRFFGKHFCVTTTEDKLLCRFLKSQVSQNPEESKFYLHNGSTDDAVEFLNNHPQFNQNITDIVISENPTVGSGVHVCVIKSLLVYCWGNNQYFETGVVRPNVLPVENPTWVNLSAFGQLTAESRLTLVGSGLGNGVATCINVKKFSVDEVTLVCWGNLSPYLGQPTTPPLFGHPPTAMQTVAATSTVSLTVASASVFNVMCKTWNNQTVCAGDNSAKQLGRVSTAPTSEFLPIDGFASGVRQIEFGGYHACLIASNLDVHCWGQNLSGQVDPSLTARMVEAMPIVSNLGVFSDKPTHSSTNTNHSCAIQTSGTLKCWGDNSSGQIGIGSVSYHSLAKIPTSLNSGITATAAGESHSCAVKNNQIFCFGSNEFGQLGQGNISNTVSSLPQPVVTLDHGIISSIAAGSNHTCALVGLPGRVYCWGNNYYGQLGNGTRVSTGKPTLIKNYTDIVSISAGDNKTCAINSSGKLLCWGHRPSSVTSLPPHTSPVFVTGLPGPVSQVEMGEKVTCSVVLSKVYCFGSDSPWGSLGITQPTWPITGLNTETPVPVTRITKPISRVAVGFGHACALTTTGEVLCWGLSDYGQLGINESSGWFGWPVQVPSLTGVKNIIAGRAHTCALGGTKTWCWGYNVRNQLGFPYDPYVLKPLKIRAEIPQTNPGS